MSAASGDTPLSETRLRQLRAANPSVSAWVSANAGAGKTFVLARRVIRLLLDGTDPGRILCLTFTKAAAAEMANRVFDILARWTQFDDEELDAELADFTGRNPEARLRPVARKLFARALETPGGLKIQTLHAFCDRLLHAFPFEANVPGHFEVLDEYGSGQMLAQARSIVLQRAAREPDSDLGRALSTVVDRGADARALEAIDALVRDRADHARWIDSDEGFEATMAELAGKLGVGDAEDVAAIEREMLVSPHFSRRYSGRLIEVASAGGKTDRTFAKRLATALGDGPRAFRLKAWLDAFFTREETPRSRVVTNAVAAKFPDLDERLRRETERLSPLRERARAIRALAATRGLLLLARHIINAYRSEKAMRGVLDYGDLISRTVDLLNSSEAALWVQYKLDRGIDHILVDEAQDTSPEQWRIVEALAGEFFSGQGARRVRRTIFAVGDEKQSIFSFQGAAPVLFARMEKRFARLAGEAGLGWEKVRLNLSFRSTADVLAAVDRVFLAAEMHGGLSTPAEAPVHVASRVGEPGHVEVWPLFEPVEVETPEDWAAPLDARSDIDPATTLARQIAATLKTWFTRGEVLEATGEPIRPGDVLILLRRRNPMAELLLRALKEQGIAVAGADRLVLTDHIAVQDLMALASFVLLPEDDHALACVLKSPLIGFTDDQLFRIAHQRKGSLWAALEEAAGRDERAAKAYRRLHGWRGRADLMPPYEFFARILGSDGGRRQFFARLGSEAEEALDEFLALALDFERGTAATLQGFLDWLEKVAPVITRDLDAGRDEVRVMTVHGAKGLEAPVVFLADTCSPPETGKPLPILSLPRAEPDGGKLVLWNTRRSEHTRLHEKALEIVRIEEGEEYRRLLYVAMTRARDRLYVCGYRGGKKIREESWYAWIRKALEPVSEKRPVDFSSEPALVFRVTERRAAATATHGKDRPATDIPAWLTKRVAAAAAIDRIAPSRTMAEERGTPARSEAGAAARRAMRRGEILHRLLESLPSLPEARRRGAAERHVAARGGEFDEGERAQMVDEAMRILTDERFAAVFGPDSRAEVDISGSLELDGRKMLAGGRIDRLAVRPDGILLVDFKTTRSVPDSPETADRASIRQLAIYRKLLANLYPGRPITTALVYTVAPKLMEIPPLLLENALSATK